MGNKCQSQLSGNEISPGLVLFLLPSYLEHVGAYCNVYWPDAMKGEHYFICLDNDPEDSLWVPASSKPRFDRHVLEPVDKDGDSCWSGKTSYCRAGEIWTIPNCMLDDCAFTDRTTTGHRNHVRPGALNELKLEVARSAGSEWAQ
jgi:hypothetical protein